MAKVLLGLVLTLAAVNRLGIVDATASRVSVSIHHESAGMIGRAASAAFVYRRTLFNHCGNSFPLVVSLLRDGLH